MMSAKCPSLNNHNLSICHSFKWRTSWCSITKVCCLVHNWNSCTDALLWGTIIVPPAAQTPFCHAEILQRYAVKELSFHEINNVSSFIKDIPKWNWFLFGFVLFLNCTVKNTEQFNTTALSHAKVPAVLFTLAFVSSTQMSTDLFQDKPWDSKKLLSTSCFLPSNKFFVKKVIQLFVLVAKCSHKRSLMIFSWGWQRMNTWKTASLATSIGLSHWYSKSTISANEILT